jgi:hypothetical protein
MAYVGFFDELVIAVTPQIDAVLECSDFLMNSATFKKVRLSLSLSLTHTLTHALTDSLTHSVVLLLYLSRLPVPFCLNPTLLARVLLAARSSTRRVRSNTNLSFSMAHASAARDCSCVWQLHEQRQARPRVRLQAGLV